MDWRNAWVLVGCLGWLPLAAVAQEAEPVPQEPAAKAPARSTKQWIADLGSDSFRVRMEAEKALRALGKDALPELREAAAEAKDSEVQWRARRLVRQLEEGADGLSPRSADPSPRDAAPQRRQPGALPGNMPEDIRKQFEDMFRRMEEQFGLDIPRGRFFTDDFFQDLQSQMRSGSGQGQSMSMQIGPDGAVKVEVQERNAKGEVETKVYEAPDLESFQQQYPDVMPQHGLGGGIRLWGGPGGPLTPGQRQTAPRLRDVAPLRLRLRDSDQGASEPAAADSAVPPGPRLGVMVRPEIDAAVRDYLDLEPGIGLQVESVQPGSLAERAGLQAGDIVVKIGSQAIGSTDEVRSALAAAAEGAEVEVQYLRRGVPGTGKATKAAAPPAGTRQQGQKLEQKGSGNRDR